MVGLCSINNCKTNMHLLHCFTWLIQIHPGSIAGLGSTCCFAGRESSEQFSELESGGRDTMKRLQNYGQSHFSWKTIHYVYGHVQQLCNSYNQMINLYVPMDFPWFSYVIFHFLWVFLWFPYILEAF